jgi:hypothetical protein
MIVMSSETQLITRAELCSRLNLHAEMLNVPISTLKSKMKKLGIEKNNFRLLSGKSFPKFLG